MLFTELDAIPRNDSGVRDSGILSYIDIVHDTAEEKDRGDGHHIMS